MLDGRFPRVHLFPWFIGWARSISIVEWADTNKTKSYRQLPGYRNNETFGF
jgi:hypothetical protein